MNTFDVLADVIRDKTGTLHEDPEFRRVSMFMVIRYLSMDDRFRAVAEIANCYQRTLTATEMYRFLVAAVPQDDNTWIRYIKKPKKNK